MCMFGIYITCFLFRAGYLCIGDLVLSLNNVSLDGMSLPQAMQLINNSSTALKIEVMRTQNSVNREESESFVANISPQQSILTNGVMASCSEQDWSQNVSSGSDFNRNAVNNTSCIASPQQLSMSTLQRAAGISNGPYSFSLQRGMFFRNMQPENASNCSSRPLTVSVSGRLEQHLERCSRSSCPQSHTLTSYRSRQSSNCSVDVNFVSPLYANMNCRFEVVDVVCNNKDLGLDVQDGMLLNKGKCLVVFNVVPGKTLARYANHSSFLYFNKSLL